MHCVYNATIYHFARFEGRKQVSQAQYLPVYIMWLSHWLYLITEWGPPHNWIIYLIVCLISCLQFCFIWWEQEVLGLRFKCSWNYCRWGSYKLLNFQNLYVQFEAFKWVTEYHVHHRADIFSEYLTLLHSVVSWLWEVFLCYDFKHGCVTPWLRKCLQYWGLL